ncbi:unnamed protein product [Staurois parvus]|uniref:Uncharacterized protein n=1 Tax=Staurois parvus TaxID=386267 RepID=A0ABN9GDY7_9NEOB|nr:unnamed protein product [Staurois parvus]
MSGTHGKVPVSSFDRELSRSSVDRRGHMSLKHRPSRLLKLLKGREWRQR